jgi:coatomer protein complex subunit alpha (xenin)
VLDKGAQNIEIRDLSNSLTKTVKCPVQTTEIFYGGTASLLLATSNSVVLFDIQQQKVLGEISTPRQVCRLEQRRQHGGSPLKAQWVF